MSLKVTMLCANCNEVLSSQDDIFGTSCGHLYHFLCLRNCHTKSTNCSQCNSYKPSIFKMFLEYGETPLSWENQAKTIALHNELEESKNKIAYLEEKNKVVQVSAQHLENKLKKLNDAVNSKNVTICHLEDRLVSLEALNNFLCTELESHDIDIRSKTGEKDFNKKSNFQNNTISTGKSSMTLKNGDTNNCTGEQNKSLDLQKISIKFKNAENEMSEVISKQSVQSNTQSDFDSKNLPSNYRTKYLKWPLDNIFAYLASKMIYPLSKEITKEK